MAGGRGARLAVAARHWLARGGWIVGLTAAAALGALNGLGRVDNAIADQMLAWSGRAAPADIVIVSIDDASLAELGRWPWPRATHARLIDRLAPSAPRAIGLDLVMSEPEAAGDAVLASAMRRQGRVVLPLRMAALSDDPMVSLPVPPLAAAAAGIGHVHVALDTDGVARSLFLREGAGEVLWDHFAIELLRVAGLPPPSAAARPAGDPPGGGWQRAQKVLIPFSGPPGHVRRVSYVDALEGRVPREAFRDAIVLVGATAPGLGDAYPTPVAGEHALMPGVEISAQAFAGLREGRALRRTAWWEAMLLTLAPVALAMLTLRSARPRAAMAAVLALLPLVIVLAWLLQHLAGIQWRPSAALLVLLLLYPLWSGRRLEAAARLRELERQRQQAMHFLSHDLRAPLSATLALIELEGARSAATPAIEAQTRRALDLADAFVQLARAEAPQGYRMQVLDLRDVVTEAVDACWPQAHAAATDLRWQAPPHDCLVCGDRAMLTRALVNLIDNALKHGSRAGTPVTCGLLGTQRGWRVEVIDAGSPLSDHEAQALFTRFRRGDRAAASGSGLGLAFVREVAQQHGGAAGWRAEASGNVFFVELPRLG